MLDYVNEKDVEELWHSVHREIRRRGVDSQTADDLAQEAWLRTLRRSPKKGELGGWLRVVGSRLVSEMRRQGRNRRARELEAARTESFIDLPSGAESRLSNLVTELGEPYRTVIKARFFEGLEIAEIAARTGHSPATIRSQLHRGLGVLRVRLGIPEQRRRKTRGLFWWRNAAPRLRWDLPRLLTWGVSLVAGLCGAWGATWWFGHDPRTEMAGRVEVARAKSDPGARSRVSVPFLRIPAQPALESSSPVAEANDRPRRTVAGLVLRSDGMPEAEAEVWAGELENGAERLVACTDSLGRYEATGIDLDEYIWAASSEGWLSRRCLVGSMADEADHDLRLLPSPGKLRLTLVDERGEPVPGAQAWIDGEIGGALVSVVTLSGAVEIPTRSMRRGVTDDSGRVDLVKPNRTRLGLSVAVEGDLVASPEVEGLPGDQDLKLVLPSTGSLQGVVRSPSGAIQAGVDVELRVVNSVVRRTRTDAMGRFAFERLAPKRYFAWALAESPTGPLSDGAESVVAPGSTAEVDLQLNGDLVVHGQVLELGRPLLEARVKLFLQGKDGTSSIFSRQVDEEGRFLYAGVGLDVLRAEAFLPGQDQPVACSGDIASGSGPVVLEVTGESRLLVPVTVEFTGGDRTRPPTLAAVRGLEPRVLVQGRVDPETKRATFELPPGRYGLYAWVPGVGPWLAREHLIVSASDLDDASRVRRFSIPKPGRLRVRLDLPAEVPPEDIDLLVRAGAFSPFGLRDLGSVVCQHEFTSSADGRLIEVDLFPGRGACELRVPGFLDEERSIRMGEAQMLEIELTPERGREIEFVIDCPVHFGIHEPIAIETRGASGRERRRSVQVIAVRNEIEGGLRLEMRVTLAIPLDTTEVRLIALGVQGALRWPEGHVESLADGTQVALPVARIGER